MSNEYQQSVFEPERWGLSTGSTQNIAQRLFGLWQRFRVRFKSKTRDTSEYAYSYISGQLRMEKKRNFANIGCNTGVSEQNMQHFMSNSPWSAQGVIQQVQEEIAATPGLGLGGVLILDESANKKAGDKSAGSGRQYNGRLGKVDMSQVGTFLAYANGSVWTWVDGELYLPEHWFAPEMAELREKLGIPDEREFETKIELGWKMIQRTHANGLRFEAICCDDFYGQRSDFRAEINGANYDYMADVPQNTQAYLMSAILRGTCQSRCKIRIGMERTGSTEVSSVDAPHGTDYSCPLVRYADKNRVGGTVRSRSSSVATVRGGRATSVVHGERTSSVACRHAATTANAC
jgi:hypothetical protein